MKKKDNWDAYINGYILIYTAKKEKDENAIASVVILVHKKFQNCIDGIDYTDDRSLK